MARRTLWTWDLESYDWDKPICVVAISEHGDVERWWGPDCLQKMHDHIVANNGTYCAHFGGGYDVPLLMQYTGLRPDRIVLSGSTILAAQLGRRSTLRDTWPATLAPLAKLGKWVDLPKLDVDRSHLEQLSKQETLDYCERDTEILLRAVQAMHAYLEGLGAKTAWTAGSSAVAILEALEPGTWARMRKHRTHYTDILRPLAGVRGGRVECWARGRRENVWSYDFKSSYPARYAFDRVGLGVREATRGDKHGIFRCVWKWPHRHRRPPALDVCGAGAGWCTNWLVGEEIEAFRKCGVDVDIREGYAPKVMASVGHEFAAELYAQKEGGSPWAKVFLNSLHGKFGEDPVKDAWTLEHPAESYGPVPTLHGDYWSWLELAIDGNGFCPPHAQPIAAAQILGRARVALWEVFAAIEETGHEIYYCDTDSVHTSCPPHEMPIELGGKLGMLEYEAGPAEGFYLGPKAYLLCDNDTGEVVKSALKGVPLNSLKEGIRVNRRGFKSTDLFRGADTSDELARAKDLRRELFEDAIANPYGVAVRREGVSSFVRGLKAGPESRWGRQSLERTIAFTGRGKMFDGPNFMDWRYLTPSECAGPGESLEPEQDHGEPEWMF